MPRGVRKTVNQVRVLLDEAIRAQRIRRNGDRWQVLMTERWSKCDEATGNILDYYVRNNLIKIGNDRVVYWI